MCVCPNIPAVSPLMNTFGVPNLTLAPFSISVWKLREAPTLKSNTDSLGGIRSLFSDAASGRKS